MLEFIKYMVVDVDGTMTDGSIYYDEEGNELKKFNTRDAAAFFCAQVAGIQMIVLTGRECRATERRMSELHVDIIQQNVKDKVTWISHFMQVNEVRREEIAYIGDDLNDLNAMSLVGYVCCPSDAVFEVKEQADYIASVRGGDGAVRNCVEHILKERNQWESAYKQAYGIGC